MVKTSLLLEKKAGTTNNVACSGASHISWRQGSQGYDDGAPPRQTARVERRAQATGCRESSSGRKGLGVRGGLCGRLLATGFCYQRATSLSILFPFVSHLPPSLTPLAMAAVPDLPEELKHIGTFLQRAAEVQERDPIISYYGTLPRNPAPDRTRGTLLTRDLSAPNSYLLRHQARCSQSQPKHEGYSWAYG